MLSFIRRVRAYPKNQYYQTLSDSGCVKPPDKSFHNNNSSVEIIEKSSSNSTINKPSMVQKKLTFFFAKVGNKVQKKQPQNKSVYSFAESGEKQATEEKLDFLPGKPQASGYNVSNNYEHYTGLINYSNTCYINSLFRLMSNSSLDYIFNFTANSPIASFLKQRSLTNSLTCLLFEEYRRDKKPRVNVLGIKDFTKYVQNKMKFGTGQNDVGEVFVRIFEILATELKNIFDMNFMTFHRINHVQCLHYNHRFSIQGNAEIVLRLPVPLTGECSIEDLISNEHATRQNAEHLCQVCNLTGTKFYTEFQSVSSFLNILLKRFAFDKVKKLQSKLHTKVFFQEHLFLDIPMGAILRDRNSYQNRAHCELMGFIVHTGVSTSNGHYFAFIKKNRIWELHNDATVTQKPVKEVLTHENFRNAYLLTYRIV